MHWSNSPEYFLCELSLIYVFCVVLLRLDNELMNFDSSLIVISRLSQYCSEALYTDTLHTLCVVMLVMVRCGNRVFKLYVLPFRSVDILANTTDISVLAIGPLMCPTY